VLLEAGNAVPADLRITESKNLKIAEAALTGESDPVEKIADPLEAEDLPIGDKKNLAFKGTFVNYGRGTGVVVTTGMQTELGPHCEDVTGRRIAYTVAATHGFVW
jgi:Ca2+-transporting ATPase